jgi:RNA polymerase sigma-70 factor (ECF subfamily)
VTGEKDVLGDWVQSKYARAYRTAVLICGNPADAEESVQDAFLRVWRFRDALPAGAKRDAWLYRVRGTSCRAAIASANVLAPAPS